SSVHARAAAAAAGCTAGAADMSLRLFLQRAGRGQYCSSQFPNLQNDSQLQVSGFQRLPLLMHSWRSSSSPSQGSTGSGILSKVKVPPTGRFHEVPWYENVPQGGYSPLSV